MPDDLKTEQEEDAAFESGFAAETGKTIQPPPAKDTSDKVEDKVQQSESNVTPPPKEEPKEEKDEPVTLTKKQFDLLMTSLEDNKSLKKAVDTLSGTVGAQKQQIEQLAQAAKNSIELTDEDFKELAEQFPEVGKATKDGMRAVIKRLTGVAPPSSANRDDLQKIAFDVLVKNEWDALEDEFPDAAVIIGKVGEKTAFREWLSGKSEAYQKKVNGTFSHSVMARAIRSFNKDKEEASKGADAEKKREEAEAKKKAEADARAAALRSAVQPRGDGGNQLTEKQKSEDDEFDEGYKSEKKR